jgi:glycosyltransferase involved in cell wall biosynthesis
MSVSLKPIHVWTPGIRDDTGGIQAFSRYFVKALLDGFPDRRLRVFVRNERLAADDRLRDLKRLEVYSYAGVPLSLRSHVMAAMASLHALADRPACVLSTHLHFLPALRLLRGWSGIPYAGVLHGIESWRISSRTRAESMRQADRLLAVSQFTRDHVVQNHGIDPNRISVFANTYDAERFTHGPKPPHLLEKYGLRPDQPVLLTVSRLALSERYKGHWQVLIALKRLLQRIPDVHYLVVGTGDELAYLRAAVRMMGLDRNVTFTGMVSSADLPDHYRLCDTFVMPSTKEGFGIVFLEAAACGKPVIAGCLDGSYDAVDAGRLGILVDPHHPLQIADAIYAALKRTDPNRLLFQPAALSEAVMQAFGFETFKRQLKTEVESLLDGEKGPRPPLVPARAPQKTLRVPAERAPRVVVLTQLNSPYQVEFFNQIAHTGEYHLEVIYLTHRDKARQWTSPDIGHSHIILSERLHLRNNALESLVNADLAVFNYYVDAFAWKAIRARAATGKPWVFWGERPGFLQLGLLGMWLRRWALEPLHQTPAPIWGVGAFGIEGYRMEFGAGHSYQNVPYYSELRRFETAPSRSSAGLRTVLYSGSLIERKGVDLLARAFVEVAAENPLARFCIVGDGLMRPKLQEMLAHLADRVEWAGFQPWNKLPEFYARCSVFCFPSRYDGWGLALVEALASGLPVIGTDQTGSAVDLISHRRNGWLVKADDYESLVDALREAVALPAHQLGMMSEAARQTARPCALTEGVRNFSRCVYEAFSTWNGAHESNQPDVQVGTGRKAH